jgi:hypothetical protein
VGPDREADSIIVHEERYLRTKGLPFFENRWLDEINSLIMSPSRAVTQR